MGISLANCWKAVIARYIHLQFMEGEGNSIYIERADRGVLENRARHGGLVIWLEPTDSPSGPL